MNKVKKKSNDVLAIVGPTASGKTSLSIALSKIIDAEIISCDSRQVYKYIPIATCAPTQEELKEAKHHFVNELKPEEEFNAGEFSKRARIKIKEIQKRGKRVIIVGGSGLYLKALIDGFFEIEIKDNTIRDRLNEALEKKGPDSLYKELKKADPESAARMDPSKSRRVIRALEVFYGTGRKISELQNENVKPDFECLQTGILYDRETLYKRINERVNNMIKAGLIDEVRALQKKGYSYRTNNSLNTVGVKEAFRYLEEELTLPEMTELIKQNTRRYAKRQITWFNKDKRINWMDMNELGGEIGQISYIIYNLLGG
ncbi:MAG: tRNA (adenosine(37)-N6)-dimethylallyltransferase MiaA [Bacteroidetes bacterium]|nr:tRNA (adenosine(37)-N6)-dimethylallyltransferase MiaA [Bacteroidota bacterium]